jgi:diacylglycerol kinase (ATP)
VPDRTLVILNPYSGGRSAERRFRQVEGRLREVLGAYELQRTAGPRDAARLAREAVLAGVDRIIVAGGDGTLGEVATGILEAGPGAGLELGVLPLGTGMDFARSHGSLDLDAALDTLAEGKSTPVDVGRVSFRDQRGREGSAAFLNVASFGVSGLVVELVNRAPKLLGGRLSFLVGTVRALMRFRCRPVKLRLDGEEVFEGPLALCAAANGGWFGGGMHVAPAARLDDGLLDVIVVRELSKPQLLAKLPRIYTGAHVDDPATACFRGRLLEAEAEPGAVPLEVDGDPLGSLPVRVELVPGVVSLLGATPSRT